MNIIADVREYTVKNGTTAPPTACPFISEPSLRMTLRTVFGQPKGASNLRLTAKVAFLSSKIYHGLIS